MNTTTNDASPDYTTPAHETAEALRTALREHGLDIPGLTVEHDRDRRLATSRGTDFLTRAARTGHLEANIVSANPDVTIRVREPENIIEYPKEGLLGYLAGDGTLAEHGW